MTRAHDDLFSLNAKVSLVTGTPDDIIATIVYLVSPASDYLSGRVIFLDGGWMAS
jgi:NAD(P)-dependent dehydrogenase (short-subunit alcohol dehydrogenase family)